MSDNVAMALRDSLSIGSRLWTPAQGDAGLIVIARPRPLAAVIGGRIVEAGATAPSRNSPSRNLSVSSGGLIIVSNTRRKEPTRIVGHPDLASGASVHRGDTLYVSIAEAVYRESRGEAIELHFAPTEDDAEALRDLRAKARSRWENDRLPDGWTRPLPPPTPTPTPKTESVDGLPEELRALAQELRTRQENRSENRPE